MPAPGSVFIRVIRWKIEDGWFVSRATLRDPLLFFSVEIRSSGWYWHGELGCSGARAGACVDESCMALEGWTILDFIVRGQDRGLVTGHWWGGRQWGATFPFRPMS